MKILIITAEVWNDAKYPNNVMSNWFEGVEAEMANLYCSPGMPQNNCCTRYFQITDRMMVRSMFGSRKAGRILKIGEGESMDCAPPEEENIKLYSRLKKIASEPLRAARDLIWMFGRYDTAMLASFVHEFNPDVIFSCRMASCAVLRLERAVARYTDAPVVAFTGDDEYSLRQLSFSPVFWLRRFALRRALRGNARMYSLYYTLSERQADWYREEFGVPTKILRKCGEFSPSRIHTKRNKPIRLVYIGKLYCNRWKTLREIRLALDDVNRGGVRMVLDIYTADKVSRKQFQELQDGENSFLRGRAKPDEISGIYAESDVALHVEAFDLKNRLATRLSFSTKLIDCLSSGCAVLAVCWSGHTGYEYLASEDAALCADSPKALKRVLQKMADDQSLISEYARKAFEYGARNHGQEMVKGLLLDDLKQLLISKTIKR